MTGVLCALAGAKGATVVNFTNTTVDDQLDGYAAYQVNSDGYAKYAIDSSGYINYEQWCTPATDGGNFEVKATISSGTVSSGTTGSWLATSTNPTWTKQRATPGTSTVTLSMEVRAAGGSTVLDTWTVTLTATMQI